MKVISSAVPGSVNMYNCPDCGKMFKTSQHLNQHKNRKKVCTLYNKHLSETVNLPTKTTSDDLQVTDVVNFIKTAEDIQNLLNDKKMIEEYKKTMLTLKEENETLKEQLNRIQQIIQPTKKPPKFPCVLNISDELDNVIVSPLTDNEDNNTKNYHLGDISNNNKSNINDDDETSVETTLVGDDTTIESK